jgi:hypothetical protein
MPRVGRLVALSVWNFVLQCYLGFDEKAELPSQCKQNLVARHQQMSMPLWARSNNGWALATWRGTGHEFAISTVSQSEDARPELSIDRNEPARPCYSS